MRPHRERPHGQTAKEPTLLTPCIRFSNWLCRLAELRVNRDVYRLSYSVRVSLIRYDLPKVLTWRPEWGSNLRPCRCKRHRTNHCATSPPRTNWKSKSC